MNREGGKAAKEGAKFSSDRLKKRKEKKRKEKKRKRERNKAPARGGDALLCISRGSSIFLSPESFDLVVSEKRLEKKRQIPQVSGSAE